MECRETDRNVLVSKFRSMSLRERVEIVAPVLGVTPGEKIGHTTNQIDVARRDLLTWMASGPLSDGHRPTSAKLARVTGRSKTSTRRVIHTDQYIDFDATHPASVAILVRAFLPTPVQLKPEAVLRIYASVRLFRWPWKRGGAHSKPALDQTRTSRERVTP